MKIHNLDTELKAANPFPPRALTALEIASAEAELGEAIAAGPASAGDGVPAAGETRHHRLRRPRRVVVALVGGLGVVAALMILLLSGGGAPEG
ncbi:MAG TPA: hypothetical protein VIY71_02390, partial [Solirubrobacterales bacterium]